MARDWKCAHCGTANPATTLTCAGCRRIQGSVVVPQQAVAPGPSDSDQQANPPWNAPAPAGAGATGWQVPAEKPSLRRFVLGSLLVVLLLVVGASAAIIGAVPVAPVAEPTATPIAAASDDGHEVLVTRLEVGDCFDFKDEDAEEFSVVLAKACTAGHRFELFHIVTFPEGAWPGLDWIESSAQARCQPALEDYTGKEYNETAFLYSWFYPTEEAWVDDDRSVQCFAYLAGDGLLMASLRAESSVEPTARPSASVGPTSEPSNSLETIHVSDLRPGDCWTTESWEPTEQGNVTRILCGLRHQFEVVWTGTYSGNTYPSSEGEMLVYIDTQCAPAFEDYVGVPQDGAPYDVWWTYPTAERWLEGDRSLVCSAFDIDGPIAHTVKDVMRP